MMVRRNKTTKNTLLGNGYRAKGNVKYLQYLSYMNITDSKSLENCIEICVD